jgi:hypothetical protein
MVFNWHGMAWSHRGWFEAKGVSTSRVSQPARLPLSLGVHTPDERRVLQGGPAAGCLERQVRQHAHQRRHESHGTHVPASHCPLRAPLRAARSDGLTPARWKVLLQHIQSMFLSGSGHRETSSPALLSWEVSQLS